MPIQNTTEQAKCTSHGSQQNALTLVLHPTCVPEEVRVITKIIPWNRVLKNCQPNSITPKMTGCKLDSGVQWQGMLKKKGIKQMGCKTRVMCTKQGDSTSNTSSLY